MATLSAAVLAAIRETVTAAVAEAVAVATIQSAPTAPSEASAHFKAADIPCRIKACTRTAGFKTTSGRDWHEANMHKAAPKA